MLDTLLVVLFEVVVQLGEVGLFLHLLSVEGQVAQLLHYLLFSLMKLLFRP